MQVEDLRPAQIDSLHFRARAGENDLMPNFKDEGSLSSPRARQQIKEMGLTCSRRGLYETGGTFIRQGI